jgi:hypothetical protein
MKQYLGWEDSDERGSRGIGEMGWGDREGELRVIPQTTDCGNELARERMVNPLNIQQLPRSLREQAHSHMNGDRRL